MAQEISSYTLSQTLSYLASEIKKNTLSNIRLEQYGSNLDAILATGYYFITGQYENLPSENATGMLLVFNNGLKNNNSNQIFQLFFDLAGLFYIREKIGSEAFSTWKVLTQNIEFDENLLQAFYEFATNELSKTYATVSLVDEKISQLQPTTIDINQNTDLDDLYETGIYFLGGDGVYTNHPLETEQSGLLLTYSSELVPEFRTYQILIAYKNKFIYVRNVKGQIASDLEYENNQPTYKNNWTPWERLNEEAFTPLKMGELKAELDAMPKNEFLEPVEGNLFDNKFIEGYRISGPRNKTEEDDLDEEYSDNSRYSFEKAIGFKGTAILKISPNTSYWVGLDRVIRETRPETESPGDTTTYSYFALATAKQALKVGDNFNGDVFRKQPQTSIIGHIITTGPEDEYLYVQTCRGDVAPYLEIVKIDLDNLPIELENANKRKYTNANKKLNDNGYYILDTEHWTTLTQINEYNSVKYRFTDKINLAKDPNIINLNNKVDSAVSNILSVEVINESNNLFDGDFISYTKGYRIGGKEITSMSKSASANNALAPIEVEIGKVYHIYISPRGKESSSGSYSYFLKIGASNLTKNEILRHVDRNADAIPLGEVLRMTTQNVTDLYLKVADEYFIGNNQVDENKIIPKTLIIQTSGDCNTPFIKVEEINKLPTAVSGKIGKYNDNIKFDAQVNINQNTNSYGTIKINYGKVNYELRHEQHIEKGTNTWRFWSQGVDNAKFFSGQDCEGPIRLKDIVIDADGKIIDFTAQNDYISGFHGNEIMESVSLLADGQKIDLTKSQKLNNCKTLSMIVESNCYPSQKHLYPVASVEKDKDNLNKILVTYLDGDTNTATEVTINSTQITTADGQVRTVIGYEANKLILNYAREDCIFHRIKHLKFCENKLNILNHWVYTGPANKYAFDHGFYTGLYSILFEHLTNITSNYTNRLFTIPPKSEGDKSNSDLLLNERSKYLTKVDFFGKGFSLSIESLRGQGPVYEGRISNMLPGSGRRYKAYFADYGTKKDPEVLSSGDEFIGEFEITTTVSLE